MRQNIISTKIKLWVILILILSSWAPLSAQQEQSILISGSVKNEYGKALQGVTVVTENRNYRTITDFNGEFSMAVDGDSKFLVFSLVGFHNKKVEIIEGNQYDINLEFDAHNLTEVIDLGYSKQERREISGAVATVSGEELKKAPVANLTQALQGRLSGLFTQETFSELSRANTDMFVRGLSSARRTGPLVMVDGIVNAYNSNQTLEYISPEEIESITVLKDASTQALYGIQGANGLIVVTTKRGSEGGLKIDTRFDQSFQQVTTKPTFYNSAKYAELMNQAASNDGLASDMFDYYSQEQIDNYRNATDLNLYTNNNWYNNYMKDYALMQRVGVNLTGGNNKVKFFSNVNFMHQGGQFKTDQTEYNSNANNIWLNFRSNVDMELTPFLKGFARLSGNIKRERTPGSANSSVYNSIFYIPSNVYGPVTPEIVDEDTGEILQEGGKVLTTQTVGSPTYGMLNRSGYRRHTVTNINAQVGLDLDMSFLTQGLSLSGIFAYQTNSVGSLSTTQDYERWVKKGDFDEFLFQIKGANNDTPLAYGKSSSYYYHLSVNSALNYNRNFGKHSVTGLAYAFYQDLTKTDTSSPYCLPYRRLSSGVEASYSYDNRYFAKVDLGYSGSEQYAKDKRYTYTPAVSGAWLMSNEAFMNDVDWLSLLKLRASYG
ncbi:MAG: SusC/RagA family TonB-linked outer membrane protein, partial [Draconibacterium sp.]